jgi:ferredoxin-NADP reductase
MCAYRTTLLGRTEVAEGTMAFQFEKPTDFVFKPGQYIDLTISDSQRGSANGLTRTFSITSSPFDKTLLVTTRMRNTVFKQALSVLPIGSAARIEGPMGSFSLHNNTASPAVFLAGGIGIDRAIPQHALLRNRGKASPFYCSVLREPPVRGCRVHGFALEVGVCKSKVPLYSDPDSHDQQ